uniref:BPTI/Kunitz inhibitor domain-containing protein n=1 Tax=Mola mola TaxID=94237 RepID=A0A3Q3VMA9_MOLML
MSLYSSNTLTTFTSLTASAIDRCLEPMSEGTCSEFVLLWFFHLRSGECRPFVYGGCGGNGNRFSSRQECQSWCESVKCFKKGFCFNDDGEERIFLKARRGSQVPTLVLLMCQHVTAWQPMRRLAASRGVSRMTWMLAQGCSLMAPTK